MRSRTPLLDRILRTPANQIQSAPAPIQARTIEQEISAWRRYQEAAASITSNQVAIEARRNDEQWSGRY